MSIEKLTASQQRVFDFICAFCQKEGYPPTYADIALQFGFKSDGTVKTYLLILARKGYIQHQGHARGIRILKASQPTAIPIKGAIAAGSPINAIEEFDGTLADIPELQYREGRIALRIKGESMINAGILEGDLAIIQTGVPVENGQIGAVMLEDSATLKRVFRELDRVRLKSENPAYPDILISHEVCNSRILGRFIALVRRAAH